MADSETGIKHQSDSIGNKEEFVDYLSVLFPLIEGNFAADLVRLELKRFLGKHSVPADIELMLKDLFITRFSQPL